MPKSTTGESLNQYLTEKQLNYSLSNTLISAKGKRTSLLNQKLFAMALCKSQFDPADNSLKATFYTSELKGILGVKGNSIYDRIKELTKGTEKMPSILDWRIFIEDDEKQAISAYNVVTDADFKDGKLTIRYNTKLTPQIKALQSNYTRFNLEETIQMKSIYAWKLHQILKSKLDYDRAITHETSKPDYVVIGLNDLKLSLDIIPIDKEVEKLMSQAFKTHSKIDDDLLAQHAKTYANFGKFRERVLERAKAEIEEYTPLRFEFEPIKAGKGGKVVSVRFKIWNVDDDVSVINTEDGTEIEARKEIPDEKITISETEFEDIIIIVSMFGGQISPNEARALYKDSGHDVDKIRRAYELMLESTTVVNNPVGWCRKCLQEGYKKADKTRRVKADFQQNEYDFEQMEMDFVRN